MSTEKTNGLKELIERGYVFPAMLPEKNDFLLTEEGKSYRKRLVTGTAVEITGADRLSLLNLGNLDSLAGYTVPIISHDYGAKTPQMWNALYEKLGLKIRSIMLVADPANAEVIINTFRRDPKYLGGGFGVGFKEKGIAYLDRTEPADLASVNIVVKEAGTLVGHNTDARGFLIGLEDKFGQIGKSLDEKTFIVFGAGGVAKEVLKLLAERRARIIIINRTVEKAYNLATELKNRYGVEVIGAGEEQIVNYVLDRAHMPDAVINLTDKGSDGKLREFSSFAPANESNEKSSREIARELALYDPKVVIADIVLPKNGLSKTIELAKQEGLKNLVDGIPMVVNQAAPAYILVQNSNPIHHDKKINENEALEIFKRAIGFN